MTYVSKIYWRLAVAGCCPLDNRSTWPAPASFPSILCTRAWRTICGVRASRCPCATTSYGCIYVMGARLKRSDESQRRDCVWILKKLPIFLIRPFDSFYFFVHFLRHKNASYPPTGRKLNTDVNYIFSITVDKWRSRYAFRSLCSNWENNYRDGLDIFFFTRYLFFHIANVLFNTMLNNRAKKKKFRTL